MKKWNYYIAGLLAVLGILILCLPAFFVVLLGLGAIAYGVYNFLYTKKLYEDSGFGTIILVRCIGSIIIGILAVFFPITMGKTIWNATMYILAIYLVCTAGLGFYSTYLLRDSKVDFKNYLYENLGLLVVAVLLFMIPGTVGNVFKNIIGIGCIVAGAALAGFTYWKKSKITVVDVEVVDDENAAETTQTSDKTENQPAEETEKTTVEKSEEEAKEENSETSSDKSEEK